MFKVTIGNSTATFETMDAARAHAEKESWIQALPAVIRTPQGQTVRVKIGNVP